MNIISDLDFFSHEISMWKYSPQRIMQIKGYLYYNCEHDILHRMRTAIGEDGEKVTVDNLPNNRIIDNQYGKMVSQKANYLLGKPFVASSENKKYESLLRKVFDARFRRTLKAAGKAMLCGGIAWLYPFYDEKGDFSFKLFPAYEILPFWKDSGHTVLDCAVRLYQTEVYDGLSKRIAEKVEIFSKNGVQRFDFENGRLERDKDAPDFLPYVTAVGGEQNASAINYGAVPLVALKYTEQELPLLKRVKTLQDGINVILSDFVNNLQEDARNTILILKNFDGENLGEFRKNLAAYGAIKVRSDGNSGGGVDTISVEVNAENYQVVLKMLKRALVENAMGYDSGETRSSVNLNQMYYRSMYSDIDLDANDMETELQASFADIIRFVNVHFLNTLGMDFSGEEVDIVFNRDMLVNESEIIESCVASKGILSEETIVEQHPWVNNVQKELDRLKKDEAAAVGVKTMV